MNSLFQWIFLALVAAQASFGAQHHTTAKLLLAQTEAKPGDTVQAAIAFKMDPTWHIYWRNPGIGIAPTVEWSLPADLKASGFQWPLPEKVTVAGLIAYAYESEVLLPFTLTISPNAKLGNLKLSGKASWLECDPNTCLPADGPVEATLTIAGNSTPSPDAARIEEWLKKIPQPEQGMNPKASWAEQTKPDERIVVLEWTPRNPPQKPDFYPFESDQYSIDLSNNVAQADSKVVRLKRLLTKSGDKWPIEVGGLIFDSTEGPERAAYQATFHLATETTVATATGAKGKPKATAATPAVKSLSLAAALGLAFLGGLILNIMPCVLPVIALKILSFVNQSREAPGHGRKLGLVYGLGVLVSFWVLASVVIAIQQAGHLAAWGMQFGNPIFLVSITILVVLVSLNLFGVFEVYIGGGTLSAAGELASKEGASGAFFNGVLATILATPCTAPALAPAIGFAFAQPPMTILAIFTAVALGLAAPYVVLSFQPGWLRFLPKPGNWMVKFKMAMGFPMLATAAWLFALSTSLLGRGGTLWLGLFLVTLSFSAWLWGEFVQKRAKGKSFAMVLAAVMLVSSYAFVLEHKLDWRHPKAEEAAGGGRESGGIKWEKWSAEAVAKARAEGHPVLVDFTADWCLTCQANRVAAIEVDSVRKKLQEIKAVSFVGDYTRLPSDITQELRRFQRAGVPLVLVYPAGTDGEAIILPNLMTSPGPVLDALNKVSPSAKNGK